MKFYKSPILCFILGSLISFVILGICFLLYRCSSGIDDVFYAYKTTKYELSNSYEYDRFYKYETGEIIELPFLPSGLELKFNSNSKEGLPYLLYMKMPAYPQNIYSDGEGYSIKNIKSISFNEELLLLVTIEDEITIINLDNPLEKWNLDSLDETLPYYFLKHYEFEARELKIQRHLVEYGFSIQDRRKNKYYNTNESTAQIEGIVRIGLCENKFYFGETIYAYFVLDLETDEIIYFKNKKQYDDFCKENVNDFVNILESQYLYNKVKNYL